MGVIMQERKELIKGSFRDRHFNAGSILLGFGVFESVGGCLNTWFRTGKLFPGPHLFAGAGTVTFILLNMLTIMVVNFRHDTWWHEHEPGTVKKTQIIKIKHETDTTDDTNKPNSNVNEMLVISIQFYAFLTQIQIWNKIKHESDLPTLIATLLTRLLIVFHAYCACICSYNRVVGSGSSTSTSNAEREWDC